MNDPTLNEDISRITALHPEIPPEGYTTPWEGSVGYIPGQIFVKFSQEVIQKASERHLSIGASVLKDYSSEGAAGLQLVKIPDSMNLQEAISSYQSFPGVLYAEPDYIRYADIVPDDPEFWRQWGLLNNGQIFKENISPGISGSDIKAVAAWNTTTSSNSIVAVLDTGVDYLHPDLAENIWTDPVYGTHGYDVITGELDPMDLASHGTHCAGVIGAVGDNSLGITGVNWNATIMPVRFLNSFGTGPVSDEITAILWASSKGANIFSCSYGGDTFSQAEYDLITTTPGLFICSAGNSGVDTDINPQYPSGYDLPNIISVAATGPSDNLASFSNWGNKTVDLGAPGEDIYSTLHNRYTPVPIWSDSFSSFANWTIQGNWTLDNSYYVSPPSSASGFVNLTSPNSTDVPLVLTLNAPLDISGLKNPVISYQWSMVGIRYGFSLEGSSDGNIWFPLEYEQKSFMITPFMQKTAKIPADLMGGNLFIRFTSNGTFSLLGIDDVMLSEGYGELKETRYGYMSGTSMAAPMVSGMVAILSSYAPEVTRDEIKTTILSSADQISSLQGRTVSGGRANLSAALDALRPKPPAYLPLMPGWNHVSVAERLKAGYDTAAVVFGSVTNSSGHSVLQYDNATWRVVRADELVTPLSSYWVWTNTKENIPLQPDPVQSGTYEKLLTEGWNGFGPLGTTSLPAKDQLSPVSENWTYVIGFNATGQIYDEPIIRGGTGNQSDERLLSPWSGYWLYMTDNITYTKIVL